MNVFCRIPSVSEGIFEAVLISFLKYFFVLTQKSTKKSQAPKSPGMKI